MPLKYEEIAQSLRSRIDSGEFPPGSVLPSGRDLCEQWHVSRATVNKAIDLLRADALIIGRPGAGFRVTDTPLARPVGDRRLGTTRTTGMPFRRLGAPTFEIPPRRVAEALELKAGAQALRRARLLQLMDGTPHSLAVAWFRRETAEACPRLMQAGPIPEGTTRYVEQCTGRSPVEGLDVEEVRLATEGEAEILGLERPCAVLTMLHCARDQHGSVLVVEEGATPQGMWQRVARYPMGGKS